MTFLVQRCLQLGLLQFIEDHVQMEDVSTFRCEVTVTRRSGAA